MHDQSCIMQCNWLLHSPGKQLMNILVIDDDSSLRRTLHTTLEALGHKAVEAGDGQQALNLLGQRHFDVALLDLRLAQEQGLDLLPRLLSLAPDVRVVVVTAYATIETAVEAMRRGAFDYLPKPFTPDQLRVVLDRIAHVLRLQSQVDALEEQVRSVMPEIDLQTSEPQMREALDVAMKTASSDATILLRGESGTGKGVVARAIHARSSRSAGPFVTVNCPSLSAELLESELFGHVQGAFTGAVRDTLGKVSTAEGGTLFLDEIGDLPPPMQPKLLRLLQERCYERVGETRTRSCNVRVIAATNHDLQAEIAAGRFREDLFYRLNVIEVALPPLRRRTADILPLAEHLLRFFARQSGKNITGFAEPARDAILRHQWPGNIRELRNAVERGVILAAGPVVKLTDLPSQIGNSNQAGPGTGAEPRPGVDPLTLDQLEAEHIRRTLATTATIEEAATKLGIDPSTLYRKRKKYVI
jgi:two-component system, NtrC family, response regulator AlgB